MKRFILLLTFATMLATGAFAQTRNSYVEIVYFHRTNRCQTCTSIEKTVNDYLNTEYANELKSGQLTFKSVNYEEDSTNLLVLKYAVEGPTLLVIHHTKKGETKFDLTDVAFENAVNNPAALRKEVADKVDMFFR